MQKVRDFFNARNFTEVETPIMVTIPGMEPYLTPFETKFTLPSHLKTEQNSTINLYLNTSPELQLKKLLGAGFGNIFDIIKVFRNGEVGGDLHNPEFSMIEWYREKADYKDIMQDCESLVLELVKSQSQDNSAKILNYQNTKIDLTTPWPRKTTNELFQEYCGIDLLQNKEFEELKKSAESKNYDTNGCENWDDIYFKIFLNHIEPNLPKDRPIFVYDYPVSQAALAKKSTTNPFFAERFELYIGGTELANSFSELIDSKEQRERLMEEQNLRRQLNKTVFDIDEEFLASLESIQFPCAGIALGLDRLFMLLLDKKSIEEVILFPLAKYIN